jgi:Fe-S-cluster containining protein
MAHTAYKETAGILREQLREAQLDHVAFEQKIKPCELERCRATCCHDGVYLSAEEADGIRALLEEHGDELRAYGLLLPDESIIEARGGKSLKTATRVAEAGELADDYPDHFPKTRCVFLDREGRCGIQRLSMEQGRGAWFDKPLTCWIHPIVILPASRERMRPVVTLVTPENDPQRVEGYPGFASCTHCGRPDDDGKKARQVLAAELEMLGEVSGRDILGELNADGV